MSAAVPSPAVLFSRARIAARVAEMGAAITAELTAAGVREVTLLAVADGAWVFAADLMRAMPMPVRVAGVKLASYGAGVRSSGRVTLVGPAPEVRGRHVLIVEDILDTGLTLRSLLAMPEMAEAASVRIAVLLEKQGRHHGVRAGHVGFACPDAFAVGYGLDFDGLYRNLPDIVALPDGAHATGPESFSPAS